MTRRNFLRTTSLATAGLLLPSTAAADEIDFSQIVFDKDIYTSNNAQTIMIFLYGGPSELAGNVTNLEEIKQESQSDYDNYFGRITSTEHGFWKESAGDIMEELLLSEDMNLFRTCFSQIREDNNNKSHDSCVSQNQTGLMQNNAAPGIFTNIAQVLYTQGVINENTKLPFITMEGSSTFFSAPTYTLETFLRANALNENLDNPYERRYANSWFYYSREERDANPDTYRDLRASLDLEMDQLAQMNNPDNKIKENFDKRVELEAFINSIKDLESPVSYPNNSFADKMQTAIKILVKNPDTKIVSLGSGGLGGWDDHSDGREYQDRMNDLFEAIKSAMAHIKAEGKDGNINIMVWGDFGRGVNLNNSFGWDHGNLQNVYMFGGKNYFNHVGVVGETKLVKTGDVNRLYLYPADDSYWFEPSSVAATLYKIYGITNPEYLTGGYGGIEAGLLN